MIDLNGCFLASSEAFPSGRSAIILQISPSPGKLEGL
jgi:hypothetical protein